MVANPSKLHSGSEVMRFIARLKLETRHLSTNAKLRGKFDEILVQDHIAMKSTKPKVFLAKLAFIVHLVLPKIGSIIFV